MSWAERIGRRDARWLVALVGYAGAIGVLAGINPLYGVAAALGLAFAVAAVWDLTVGLAVFTGVSFLEVLNSSSNSTTSFMKLLGLLLFGSWYATTLTTRAHRDRSGSGSPVFLIGCASLVAWSALSVAWADSPGAALSSTSRYLLNILLFPIVLAGVRRRDQLLWVLGAFVVGATVSTLYGFASPTTSAGQSGRLTGGIGDANEQAAVLVAAIPIALGLAGALRRRRGLQLVAVALAVLCLAGVVNTLSRGGLIALVAMMVTAVVFGGRWRVRALALLVVTVLGTGYYFLALAPLASRQRVTMSDTSGRTDIWTVGWRMVRAHPVTGVGSGNFQNAEPHFLNAPGSITHAFLIVDQPHVAHNIYLEVLADMGIPGLLAFLAIVGAALAAAVRAARLCARTGQPELELVARCLVFSLVGFMVADFFLSGEFSKQLWLVFALCPAVLAIARSGVGTPPPPA
jgi:O-antigen ligase